jgi:hypothetical protein
MCRARQAAAPFLLDFATRFPPCLPMTGFWGARPEQEGGPLSQGGGRDHIEGNPGLDAPLSAPATR